MSTTIVDGTVRKPVGPWTPAVHALLRHLEAAGFDGAPHALGIREGVEVLSYVNSERSKDGSDRVVFAVGRLVRQMHDAQDGFVPSEDARWQVLPNAVYGDEVVCHNDLLGSNVLFRDGEPAAFIDWELAAPGPRGVDLVAPASYWVPLRPDADATRHDLPVDRRCERLRLLLNGYGDEHRDDFLDLVAAVWRSWHEAFRVWGGVERRARWAEAYDSGRCDLHRREPRVARNASRGALVNETILYGGDVNVVVRVGDTVRRPTGPWSDAVHALLRHFESVGFGGAPRFLGIDEQGREVLSYVVGDAALAPAPPNDDAIEELSRLVRRMHDAQDGFGDPGGWVEPGAGPVVCFRDFFPPNVIFRDGRPVALIDWDLARRGERADDVAMIASWWAPLRPDEDSARWGFPLHRRGERLLLISNAYGLDERGDVIDRLITLRRANLGRDADRNRRARRHIRWLEEHRGELEAWL